MIFASSGDNGHTLWNTFSTLAIERVIDNPSSKITLNQFEKTLILNLAAKVRHQQIMINPVKEFRQIDIHREAVSFLDDALHLFNRLLPITMGPKSKTIVRESGIENGRKHLGNGLLDHTIRNGWNPQLASSTIRFIDFNTSDR